MDDWAKMDDKMKQVKETIAQLKKSQAEREQREGMCSFWFLDIAGEELTLMVATFICSS
jgi:hypothetical protein